MPVSENISDNQQSEHWPGYLKSILEYRLVYSAVSIIAAVLFFISPANTFADYPDGYYEVGRVIDGDTFELIDGKPIRLIGIDTPEVGEDCYSQATQKLISLISGHLVYLEKDVSETDQWGHRLLRYVYVDGLFVNEALVYEGYAYADEYPPDTKYASQLGDAEENASLGDRGCLWGDPCSSGCYVHITDTGTKYHATGCRFLANSDRLICLDDATLQGYTSCSECGGACDAVAISGGSDGSGDGGGGCFISILESASLLKSQQFFDLLLGKFVSNH